MRVKRLSDDNLLKAKWLPDVLTVCNVHNFTIDNFIKSEVIAGQALAFFKARKSERGRNTFTFALPIKTIRTIVDNMRTV